MWRPSNLRYTNWNLWMTSPEGHQRYDRQQRLMGSRFELAIISSSKSFAEEQLEAGVQEIQRLEELLSEFLPGSDTWRINESEAGQAVKISPETFDLISRCQQISSLTKGHFDITTAALKKLYKFKNEEFEMPGKESVNQALRSTGFQKLKLNPGNHSITFLAEGMKISFAGIGKGYASDQVKKLWLKSGVEKGFISASGDMNVFATGSHSPWQVAIAHPDQGREPILNIPLQNASIATSGDYEQHFVHQGVRYSHNLNPLYGYPVSGIKSVSVISPGAELCDALATAVFAMGTEAGLHFVNQLPQTHAIVVDAGNQVHFSEKIRMQKGKTVISKRV